MERKKFLKIEKFWKNYYWKEIDNYSKKKNQNLKKKSEFSPYQNNGGTILGIAGKNFSIIASDTRFSYGMFLTSRNSTRIVRISTNAILATAGMTADLFSLQNQMLIGIQKYKKQNSNKCTISNCAFYLSSILYSKRFFPFFTFNLISGLEKNNQSCIFNFDALGSFEKTFFNCIGNGQTLIQPILDGIFQKKNNNQEKKSGNLFDLLVCIKKIFLNAAQKNISIGDGLQIFIISKKGIFLENNLIKID
jgi:20S proteasome subunit beta 6